MTLLVIGATDDNARQIASAAASRGVRVVTQTTSSRPGWVLTASASQRRDALARYALPAFRVIEYPDLGGAMNADVLAAGLARMAEIGDPVPLLSPRAIALTRRLLPWVARMLERALGDHVPDQDETLSRKAARATEKARRKAALLSERAPKEDSESEARRRAERKHARKAGRRTEKPSVIDQPRGPRTA